MKTLNLTLSKLPFDVMVTGEKVFEYRKDTASGWMRSRLYNTDSTKKKYDSVRFSHGYGAHRPYFVAEFKGFIRQSNTSITFDYSNGLEVVVEHGDFCIHIGKITESGNLPQP
jgi:hypothetical protein